MRKSFIAAAGVILLGGAVILSACAPSIPHTLDGRDNCLECHDADEARPYPERHAIKDLQNSSCGECHATITENES